MTRNDWIDSSLAITFVLAAVLLTGLTVHFC